MLKLIFKDSGGDLRLDVDRLATASDLETSVVISLFTDQLAEHDEELPFGETDRRGWCLDHTLPKLPDGTADRIGSKLWMLKREKLIPLVDKDTLLMVAESNPLRTFLMLPEWEDFCGLPDECSQSYETVAERRAAVVAKITATGGQSLAYLVELATNFTGQVCTGVKFQAFRAGISTAGESLTNDPWDYWYGIHVPDTVVRPFCAGASMAGEPLNTWGHARLECVINQLGPADGQALLTYGGYNG